MSERRALPIPEGLDGLRLDAALARLFGLSRTGAATLAGSGQTTLDGRVASKSDRVASGAWLEVTLAVPPAWQPRSEGGLADGLAIVHDDDDIVVVDKPPGVATHPSPGWDGPTVIGGLAAAGWRIATSGAAERQGVVHRLDAGTSGLVVVAKSERAYSSLKAQFRERTVGKVYRALVQGHPDPLSGTIDAPIDRHPTHPYRFAVVATGRPSVTHYRTLEAMRAASLVQVELETGRTHQIRVHFAALRHPCCGDGLYGADPTLAQRLGLARQWLHAARLAIDHPGDGRRVEWASSDPADLAAALERARAAR
ncbi:MAG: RluA family pseudouridine synthase [Mycobacteriales bacterium]